MIFGSSTARKNRTDRNWLIHPMKTKQARRAGDAGAGAGPGAARLVGEVEFSAGTATGRLRQPVWRGLRPDKSPAELARETPP